MSLSVVMVPMLVHAQLKQTTLCPPIIVDILDGTVNEMHSSSTMGEIKSKFPCYTSIEEGTGTPACGGAVFLKDKDIYFYTGRGYVEILENLKGNYPSRCWVQVVQDFLKH